MAEYSTKRREQMGGQGKAFKNANDEWSYPINSVQDLRNAIQAFGRAKDEDKPKLKRYIMAKARALGQADLIPDSWKGVTASATSHDEVALAEYSTQRREKLGSQGKAFKSSSGAWSYPINSVQDLRNAIQAFGRCKEEDKPKLKRYIMGKARGLGRQDLIPDTWTKEVAATAPQQEWDEIMGAVQGPLERLVALSANDVELARLPRLTAEDGSDIDENLVRLALITRVEGYRRKGDKGQTVNVTSYTRKILDAFGGVSDKTKKGAFADAVPHAPGPPSPKPTDMLRAAPPEGPRKSFPKKTPVGLRVSPPGGPRKSFPKKTPAGLPPKKTPVGLKSHVGSTWTGLARPDAKLDEHTDSFHSALENALDGKDFDIPDYGPDSAPGLGKGHKITITPEMHKEVHDALHGMTAQEAKEAIDAVKQPKVQQLLAKTPIPVLVNSVKKLLTSANAKRKKMLAIVYSTLVSHHEHVNQLAESAAALFDLTDPSQAIIENIAAIIEHASELHTAVAPLLHLLGLSAADEADRYLAMSRSGAQ